jgi:hypothetical protein
MEGIRGRKTSYQGPGVFAVAPQRVKTGSYHAMCFFVGEWCLSTLPHMRSMSLAETHPSWFVSHPSCRRVPALLLRESARIAVACTGEQDTRATSRGRETNDGVFLILGRITMVGGGAQDGGSVPSNVGTYVARRLIQLGLTDFFAVGNVMSSASITMPA